MRLFLASYRTGADPRILTEMLHGGTRVAVLAAACDAWPEPARAAAVTSEFVGLRRLGLDPVEIDLRVETDLAARLAEVSAVWVRGGNTFVLRRQLAVSGADRLLGTLVHNDRLTYCGYSAGACVTGPTLRGLEFADPPEDISVVAGPNADVPTDGLNWIDRVIVPHYGSEYLGGAESDQVIDDLRRRGVAHLPLTDDQVAVVDAPLGTRPEITVFG